MKLKIYTVYDEVAKIHQQPFIMLNDNVAKRTMQNCIDNPEHNYSLNPVDYTLFSLGEFDDETAEITYRKELLLHLASLTKANQS